MMWSQIYCVRSCDIRNQVPPFPKSMDSVTSRWCLIDGLTSLLPSVANQKTPSSYFNLCSSKAHLLQHDPRPHEEHCPWYRAMEHSRGDDEVCWWAKVCDGKETPHTALLHFCCSIILRLKMQGTWGLQTRLVLACGHQRSSKDSALWICRLWKEKHKAGACGTCHSACAAWLTCNLHLAKIKNAFEDTRFAPRSFFLALLPKGLFSCIQHLSILRKGLSIPPGSWRQEQLVAVSFQPSCLLILWNFMPAVVTCLILLWVAAFLHKLILII